MKKSETYIWRDDNDPELALIGLRVVNKKNEISFIVLTAMTIDSLHDLFGRDFALSVRELDSRDILEFEATARVKEYAE
jgi:hypothetical protein